MEELEIYEKLWSDAASAFERGEMHLDPDLPDKTNDLRRCVTLALRPSISVQQKISAFLDRVASVSPDQYFYRPDELHVTVLSIISGSEHWLREMRHLASYRHLIGDVLSRRHSFSIAFRGVTASPGSVMIQGFPAGDELAKIRDELREAFAQAGFSSALDRRYKISTAHITVMRFCRPKTDWKPLVSRLEESRQEDFGETEVENIQLLWGDWYASGDIVRTLQQYRLSGGHRASG